MTVGIKDVARLAGVSPATVSRVLAGRAVDSDMQERVLAAVKSTGYRPNLSARRLRSQHSNTIGLIVADIRNPFFTAVSRTIEDVAYARGMRVILCNTDEDPAKEEMYLRLMQEERVTGAILAPTRRGVEKVDAIPKDFPIVLIDRAGTSRQHDSVLLDNHAMAALLVRHLHEQGYRRIAGLFGAASTTGAERRAGYEQAMAQLGLDPEAVLVDHAPGAAEAAVARLLQATSRPEALIASNGVMLTRVLHAVRDMGLVIPGDVALAGFDNEPWMELVGDGLTVIEQPVAEIGRTAMTMLLDRLDHPDAAARRIVLDGRCLVRGSSTPIRRTSAAA
ncbi:LacI family DNA-binding transcriptional regulator [Flavisphingomonas formosensis]|uniref:LacI family DNA-binding transcriptional regulator n=1 Tax=Flavisphingomonas formosensis TaxID=861534 RepID=UPI0012FC79B1|nr:LacI family DNA-binding transcriptional regulator [Sphingomonas formosensis]